MKEKWLQNYISHDLETQIKKSHLISQELMSQNPIQNKLINKYLNPLMYIKDKNTYTQNDEEIVQKPITPPMPCEFENLVLFQLKNEPEIDARMKSHVYDMLSEESQLLNSICKGGLPENTENTHFIVRNVIVQSQCLFLDRFRTKTDFKHRSNVKNSIVSNHDIILNLVESKEILNIPDEILLIDLSSLEAIDDLDHFISCEILFYLLQEVEIQLEGIYKYINDKTDQNKKSSKVKKAQLTDLSTKLLEINEMELLQNKESEIRESKGFKEF